MSLPLLPLLGSRLYVEALPLSVDNETLSIYFSQFGALEECRVTTEHGVSKRFGFVSFCTPAVCQKVASIVHTINGSRVQVERMNQDHSDNFEFSLPSKKLFVSLIDLDDIDETLLRSHFSNSGRVKSVVIERTARSGRSLYAIVMFESEKSVDDAVDSVHILGGNTLIVKKVISSEEVKKGRQSERERSARETRIGRMDQNYHHGNFMAST